METQQSHMMTDQGEQRKSWMLYHILDRHIGSREVVAISRKTTLLFDQIAQRTKHPVKIFSTGSSAEGMEMKGSDMDFMMIDSYVKVLSGDEDVRCVEDNPEKTVFVMRDTNSRPGYVILQLVNLGEEGGTHMADSIISVGDQQFISSEIYTDLYAESGNMETHGPAVSLMKEHDDNEAKGDFDFAYSFPCTSWPWQANEWRNRPRLYGWPNETLRNQIVKGGCYLVPVGDTTSSGAFLQWRISFTTAERKLIYSLTHIQFLVYGILKYLLKQIAGALKQLLGDTEVVSSYILKTTVFYAVENTPESFWKEDNIFHCFMFCIKILIYWVHAGYCPNYFIRNNNMFLGKVHGENQKRLLSFLVEIYGINWECLSIGKYIQPSLGQLVSRVRNGEWQIAQPTATQLERDRDLKTFSKIFPLANKSFVLPITLKRLSESSSDLDEFIGYFTTTKALCAGGITIFEKHHATAKGNKQRYKALRICKRFMAPFSSVCTCPGLLLLATFHYQTGNYMKAIELCEQMISSFKMFVGDGSFVSKDMDKYKHLYCGRGYTLLQKCQQACSYPIHFQQESKHFCPSQLHLELENVPGQLFLIPPLPYAVFLTFLCYNFMGETTKRDQALVQLQTIQYDEEQGTREYWIVHTFMGICHEMVGDIHSALIEYRNSTGGTGVSKRYNPACERIEHLQRLYQSEDWDEDTTLTALCEGCNNCSCCSTCKII